ncbi:DNRLRE domain-containing protein [Ruminococcus flavefaciens]|uniref:DNRLRE domain-containing protein n=1 Tax=Ruminococcus flavefaciens TaxID=1265 RepID=UPI0026F19B76|nr:DNRLRE domain-containing protein [Ruminococcus flavefaciens]
MKLYRRISALITVCTMILANNCYTTAVAENQVSDTSGNVLKIQDTSVKYNIVDESKLIPIDEAMNECKLLQYIDVEQFLSSNFEYRVPSYEELNSYAFITESGDKVVYIMDENTKFINSYGEVVEKDLSLLSSEDGFEIAKNDFDLLFPYDLSNGISINYQDCIINMLPCSLSDNTIAEKENGSVIYKAAFDENCSLSYVPLLSGIKENIILSSYEGKTQYDFLIKTNGLSAFYGEDGWYFAPKDNSLEKFKIGNVEIYDAAGKLGTGSLNITQTDNEGEYIVHIFADVEFLTDESTSYPVTIDPSITVSDNTHGSNSIVDASVFSGYPTSNFGGFIYNRVGTNSVTYGIGRTVVKLPGLTNTSAYQGMIADQITDVKFYAKEANGGASQYINVYALNNSSWTESNVTWNNVGSYDTSVNYGAAMINNQWTAFDITNLVKGWKNNIDSADAGFIFINSNESNDESFCSSEFSTTSSRPYVTVTYYDGGSGGGNSFDNASNLTLNNDSSVVVAYGGEKRYFKFTAPSTGFYTFESSDIIYGDPYGYLYNSNHDLLTYNDDSGSGNNFRITYHLMASYTYYFSAGCFNTGVGNYTIRLYPTTSASYIENPNVLTWGNTSNISIGYSQASMYYEFTPDLTGEYLFYSYANTGDPRIWLYNSNLALIDSNDDTAGNNNFRLAATLTAGQSYYVSVGHFGINTGSYTFNLMKSSTLLTGNYFLRNNGTMEYMDIDGPGAQEWVHQWTAHTGLQERWTFQKLNDGYYTIRSLFGNNYYVGISTTATGIDNIKLYSSVSDNTKWKIFELSDKHVILEPKTAVGKILYVPNSTIGTELQLSLMGADLSNRNQWTAVNIGAYYAQVYSYFDDGYSVYYGESRVDSVNRLNGYLSEISKRYYDLLGLTVLFDGASYYNSPIDICKGTVTSSNIDTLCNHAGTIHTDRPEVISSFSSSFLGSNTITNILWSDHRIKSIATNGTINYNRSCSSGTSIIMIERSGTNVRDRDSKGVLMHELNHQYGARDHYHELADINDPNSCKFKDICSDCGTNPRPSTCIMYQSRIDIANTNVICSECQADILSHLNGHHSS